MLYAVISGILNVISLIIFLVIWRFVVNMKVNSIELFINEIHKCLSSDCELSALIVALIIPDICGKVLFPKDKTGDRYKKWFDLYIGDYEKNPSDELEGRQMPYMSGKNFYTLRCAMLHEGTDDIASTIQINDLILLFGQSCSLEIKTKEQGTVYLTDGTKIEHPSVVTWAINIRQLCQKIICAAEAFLKYEVDETTNIPTIQIQP